MIFLRFHKMFIQDTIPLSIGFFSFIWPQSQILLIPDYNQRNFNYIKFSEEFEVEIELNTN